jgi:hypothetical protein
LVLSTQLAGAAADIAAGDITKVISYCDTIGVYCWRRLPAGLFSQLRRQYGGNLWPRQNDFGWVIEINQPTRQTLTQLAPFEGELFCLSRADIATDLLTSTKAEAISGANLVKQHMIQNWRRRQESVTVETTTYWCRRARRNIAVYGDRPSKVTGQPCVHVEMRFVGAGAVKRAKIDFKALIEGVDTLSLLQHQAKLATIDDLKLKTILMQFALNTQMKYPASSLDETRKKVHHMLLGATGTESIDEISSQALYDVRAFRGCLRVIQWSDLIPQPVRWCVSGDATQVL